MHAPSDFLLKSHPTYGEQRWGTISFGQLLGALERFAVIILHSSRVKLGRPSAPPPPSSSPKHLRFSAIGQQLNNARGMPKILTFSLKA
jgi:hypothetical protein